MPRVPGIVYSKYMIRLHWTAKMRTNIIAERLEHGGSYKVICKIVGLICELFL